VFIERVGEGRLTTYQSIRRGGATLAAGGASEQPRTSNKGLRTNATRLRYRWRGLQGPESMKGRRKANTSLRVSGQKDPFTLKEEGKKRKDDGGGKRCARLKNSMSESLK